MMTIDTFDTDHLDHMQTVDRPIVFTTEINCIKCTRLHTSNFLENQTLANISFKVPDLSKCLYSRLGVTACKRRLIPFNVFKKFFEYSFYIRNKMNNKIDYKSLKSFFFKFEKFEKFFFK